MYGFFSDAREEISIPGPRRGEYYSILSQAGLTCIALSIKKVELKVHLLVNTE